SRQAPASTVNLKVAWKRISGTERETFLSPSGPDPATFAPPQLTSRRVQRPPTERKRGTPCRTGARTRRWRPDTRTQLRPRPPPRIALEQAITHERHSSNHSAGRRHPRTGPDHYP